MKTLSPNLLSAWKISYNAYSDVFQMFNSVVYKTPDSELASTKKGDAVLTYHKKDKKPLLIEVKNAYTYLGDVDNMSKEDIIQGVIGYVKNYG